MTLLQQELYETVYKRSKIFWTNHLHHQQKHRDIAIQNEIINIDESGEEAIDNIGWNNDCGGGENDSLVTNLLFNRSIMTTTPNATSNEQNSPKNVATFFYNILVSFS
jgi:hypothetical protein